MPKLPSTVLLFQTLLELVVDGYAPLSVAFPVPQLAVVGQTGGKGCPTARMEASPVYTLRDTTILPDVNPEKVCARTTGDVAASTMSENKTRCKFRSRCMFGYAPMGGMSCTPDKFMTLSASRDDAATKG